MHMRGRPSTMYAEARYGDVIADVTRELDERLTRHRGRRSRASA